MTLQFEDTNDIFNRRFVQFTLSCINNQIEITLKEGKIVKGMLYSLTPEDNTIVLRKYHCGSEKGEYKIIKWKQILKFTATCSKDNKKTQISE